MRLFRTTDAEVFNRVANHPEIRPGLGNGAGPLDFTTTLRSLDNFGFACEHGGFLIIHQGPARYELHTLFDTGLRGRAALNACAETLRFMFAETDAEEIVTRAPANLPHADLMARRAGFRPVFRSAYGWDDAPVTAFSMTLDEWRVQDGELISEGERFYSMLEEAAARDQDHAPLHPHEDPDHERAAGMVCLMAKAGNHHKAVAAHGRWAALASFRPINLLSLSPAVYDVGDALVMARNGGMEVLKWLRAQ
jgi:hypothetical protein